MLIQASGDSTGTAAAKTWPRRPQLSKTRAVGKKATSRPGVRSDPRRRDAKLDPTRVRWELASSILIGGLALAVGVAVIATWNRLGWGTPLRVIVVSACGGVIGFALFQLRGVWDEISAAVYRRRLLERQFGRYVSPGVADAIIRGGSSFGRGEIRDVTVLFCDLRDFTTLCERRRPQDVVELLNTFYGEACRIVQAQGGTVNKFMGDGLLALFGAPEHHPNHVAAAAEAAHEMIYAVDELRKRGGIWEYLDIGIGLDSGDVVVGDIGARERAEYTAIGTTVNRAARLQGLSREAHRRIVLSEDTANRLGPRANVVGMGSVKLKGLSVPVKVYAFRHS